MVHAHILADPLECSKLVPRTTLRPVLRTCATANRTPITLLLKNLGPTLRTLPISTVTAGPVPTNRPLPAHSVLLRALPPNDVIWRVPGAQSGTSPVNVEP